MTKVSILKQEYFNMLRDAYPEWTRKITRDYKMGHLHHLNELEYFKGREKKNSEITDEMLKVKIYLI